MAAAGALLGIGSTLYGAYQQSNADKQQAAATEKQGRYQQGIYDQNAANAEISAQDAIKAGDINAERLQTGAKGTVGAQRASYGSQGVRLGSGSSADVAADTIVQSGVDASMMRENAWKQAFGIRANAQNEIAQGEFARMSSQGRADAYRISGNTSLATGGLKAAGQYLDYYDRKNSTRQPSVIG